MATLSDFFTSIANAIRGKSHITGNIPVSTFATVIRKRLPSVYRATMGYSDKSEDSYSVATISTNKLATKAFGMLFAGSDNSTDGTISNMTLTSAVQQLETDCFAIGWGAYTGSSSSKEDFERRIKITTLYVQNPNLEVHANIGTGTHSIYFDFANTSSNVSNTLANLISVGANKNTSTYNIYTDNSTIKAACEAKAGSYTTINMYHRDGSAWS